MIKSAGQPGYRVRYRPGEVRSSRRGRRGRGFQEWFVGITRAVYWLGLGVLVVYAAYQSWHIFYWTAYFKVQEVEITGTKVLQKQDILSLTRIELGTHFFRYQPEEIRASLLMHPRIRDVRVEQLSPRKIAIQIRENPPLLRTVIGDTLHEVGEDGRLLSATESKGTTALPLFLGLPEGLVDGRPGRRIAPEFFAQIPGWLEALRGSFLSDFEAVDFKNPYRTEVRWHGMRIFVGEPQDISAMGRHVKALLAETSKHHRTVESLDLRFRMLVVRYGSASATPLTSWTAAEVAAVMPSTTGTAPTTGGALTSHPAVLAAASTTSVSAEVMTSESAMFNEAELKAIESSEATTQVATAPVDASSKPAFDTAAETEEIDESPDPAYIYNPPSVPRDDALDGERFSRPPKPRLGRFPPTREAGNGDQ